MQSCLKNFTVTVGTVFERSKIRLNKWLLATYLLSSSKKGMSAHQIHRMLGVTYKTAWFMMHRIREAMKDDSSPLGGPGKIVESDEAFVGGFKKKRLSRQGRSKEEGRCPGRARRSRLVRSTSPTFTATTFAPRWSRTSHRSLAPHDRRCPFLLGHRQRVRRHETTLHSNREFSRGDGNHTNTAENFFRSSSVAWSAPITIERAPTFIAIWPSSISATRPGTSPMASAPMNCSTASSASA